MSFDFGDMVLIGLMINDIVFADPGHIDIDSLPLINGYLSFFGIISQCICILRKDYL